MFPLLHEKATPKIDSLKTDILAEIHRLSHGLHPKITAEISDFMLTVNSYYTNAMEGNPSKLKDINKALNGQFAAETSARNFQLEHVAHIRTQKKMEQRLSNEKDLNICSPEFLCWIHKTFYEALPTKMQTTRTESGEIIPIIPGEIREQGIVVGLHHAPERRSEIAALLDTFSKRLNPLKLNPLEKLTALAASHHRLLWIHPFADGNGRVARLFTAAFAERAGIAANHLWSASRAFARNRVAYDEHLTRADQPPRNSFDGRGPLSEEGLIAFCEYFLACCLDQIKYTAGLLALEGLETRFKRILRISVDEGTLSAGSCEVMERLFYQGEIVRGDVQKICHVKERRASTIIRELLETEFAHSPSAHGPLRLKISPETATYLFPDLV